MRLYTVYDRVAKESGNIFDAKNDDIAIRKFTNLLKSDENIPVKDMDLYYLGEYDPEKMELRASGVADIVYRGVQYTFPLPYDGPEPEDSV